MRKATTTAPFHFKTTGSILNESFLGFLEFEWPGVWGETAALLFALLSHF